MRWHILNNYKMKIKKIATLLFLPLVFLLIGCPVGLIFPADIIGKNPIDSRLLGTWETDNKDIEITKVKLSDNGNNTYSIEILTRGEMYSLETDHMVGWITRIGGYDILIAQPDNDQKYYHYMFRFDTDGNLVIADVPLIVDGVDGITSTESLRAEILASSKLEGFVAEERTYTKEK